MTEEKEELLKIINDIKDAFDSFSLIMCSILNSKQELEESGEEENE